MTSQDKRRLCGLMLFAYGGVAHLVLLLVCTRGWFATSNGSGAWKYGSAGFVTLAGGAFFYVLMRRWVGRVLELPPPRVPVYLLKGGLFGVLATLATLESLYILTAVILAFGAHGTYPEEGSFVNPLLVALMDIHLYAIVPTIVTIPFDFCYGLVGGLLLGWAGGRLARPGA